MEEYQQANKEPGINEERRMFLRYTLLGTAGFIISSVSGCKCKKDDKPIILPPIKEEEAVNIIVDTLEELGVPLDEIITKYQTAPDPALEINGYPIWHCDVVCPHPTKYVTMAFNYQKDHEDVYSQEEIDAADPGTKLLEIKPKVSKESLQDKVVEYFNMV